MKNEQDLPHAASSSSSFSVRPNRLLLIDNMWHRDSPPPPWWGWGGFLTDKCIIFPAPWGCGWHASGEDVCWEGRALPFSLRSALAYHAIPVSIELAISICTQQELVDGQRRMFPTNSFSDIVRSKISALHQHLDRALMSYHRQAGGATAVCGTCRLVKRAMKSDVLQASPS